MDPLISPAEAATIIERSIAALPSEDIDFADAQGRTLRQDLLADRDFPPFDRATMDGIACRQCDLALGSFTVQGLHAAGAPSPAPLRPGYCWRIMTGSVFPEDCDTLIPVEDLLGGDELVTLKKGARTTAGTFIHRRGSDCPLGTPLLASGTLLTAAHLGLAATLGATQLAVTRQPKIALISTGDELVPPTERPLPHQLRQSNGPTLRAILHRLFVSDDDIARAHLPDDLTLTKNALRKALATKDLILISGGISMGAKDFIRPVLEELLGPPAFHGIAQRPGKPLAYWLATATTPPVFALPGNPNSTFTTFHRYVRPALRLLAGGKVERAITLPFTESIEPHPKLTLFLPALLQSDGKLAVIRPQNSGDLASPLLASGFVEISPGVTALSSGPYWSH